MMRREYAESLLEKKIDGYSPNIPELLDYVKLFEVPGLAERAIFGRPIIVVHYINRALSGNKYVREELKKSSRNNTVIMLYLRVKGINETIKRYKDFSYLIWVMDTNLENETGLRVDDFSTKVYPLAEEVELWGGSSEICIPLLLSYLQKKGFSVKVRDDCIFE